MKKIGIIGIWHQGAVAAACFAASGYDVVGMDSDQNKIAKLSAGEAPLFEPTLDSELAKSLEAGNLHFTTSFASVKDCGVVCLMHDTPVDDHDRADITIVLEDCSSIAPHLMQDALIIVTAQVPVGTCAFLSETISKSRPELRFQLGYVPENLRLGNALHLFRNPALPIIGADDEQTFESIKDLYRPITSSVWSRASVKTAEMTKHALNAFLGMSIAFGNEVGRICDIVSADGSKVAEMLKLDPRISSKAPLSPGLGFSGGTIARDIQALRTLGHEHGKDVQLLDGLWESNASQNTIPLQILQKICGKLKGKTIAILGLTYKPGTSTLRRSLSLEIISSLSREGATINAHDPKADRNEVAAADYFTFFDDVYEAVEGADAALVITGWPDYKQLHIDTLKNRMKHPLLVDANNFLDGQAYRTAGFTYIGIGRGMAP